MDEIGMIVIGAVIVLLILAILVAATRILHGALRTQNELLKQQCLMMAAAAADEKKAAEAFRRKAEALETDLLVQIQRANGRVELLRDSLARIGINPDSLESTTGSNDFWRVSALRLIVTQIDESRIDSAANDKANALTVLTARGFISNVAA